MVCKSFGICGGCSLKQDGYSAQIKLKQGKVKALLEPFYNGEIEVTPSPNTEYFRNKIELSFCRQVVWSEPYGKKKKVVRDKTKPLEFENTFGFRLKGRWDRCVNIEDCLLYEPNLSAYAKALRLWAEEKKLSFYDQRTHEGLLRNLILRRGVNTGEGMAVLITASPFEYDEDFAKLTETFYPSYHILTAVNDGVSDASGLKDIKVIKGKGFIREKLFESGREIIFEISPQSFFQTNTKAANLIYERVASKMAELKPAVMYDFYGGADSFSLCCAPYVGKSLCVESVPSAVNDGVRNAKINKIDNVNFFCATTEDFLAKNKIGSHNSVIVLDPPRSGVHPAACVKILNSGAPQIFYVSCNPVTLAENLKTLSAKYKVTHVECFDFFPHSEHIETLAELELK